MSTQAPIRIEAKVNMSEFYDALKQIVEGSKRDISLVVNSRAMHVAAKARALTPIASREQILKTFNAIKILKVKKAGKNKGQIGSKTAYRPHAWAYYVVMAKMRAKGKWPPSSQAEIEKEVHNFVSRKLSAVGSLRAGWRGILGPLRHAVKIGLTNMRATRKGKFLSSVQKAFELGNKGDGADDRKIKREAGTVTPAGVATRAVCTGNYKVSVGRNGERKIDGRVVNALNTSFAQELSEMRQHLEERITAQWNAAKTKQARVTR